MKQDHFLSIEAFASEPWYSEFRIFLNLGACQVPNEHYPAVMDALEEFGCDVKAEKGDTDDLTYLIGGAAISSQSKYNRDAELSGAHLPSEEDEKKTVATTILQQLGGIEFIMMTGSKNFLYDGNSLSMRLARNISGANHLSITYRHHPDDYVMKFSFVRMPDTVREIEVIDGVYNDNIRSIFERVTGFDTHMPKIIFSDDKRHAGERLESPTKEKTSTEKRSTSVKTLTANMKYLGKLLSQDLSYIYGERESGPNGAKKEFLRKGAAFFRVLAKDLGFIKSEVNINKSGIACSGEVYLYGMWGAGNGISIELSQMHIQDYCIMYRTISDIEGRNNGYNQFLSKTVLLNGDYDLLLRTFLEYRKQPDDRQDAA